MRTHSTRLSAIAVLALLASVLLPIGAASAAPPKISVSNASLIEGAPGSTTVAKFKVTLSKPAPKKVTVDYETVNGRAKAGPDYVAKSGTLTFREGRSKKVVRVTIKGEDLYERNEAFFLRVSDPTRARIDDAKGKGTITNDDDPPSVSVVADANVGEGGVADFSFVLSEVSGVPARISYATADDEAEADSDYNPVGGSETISVGETQSTSLGIPTIPDTVVENDEIFVIQALESSSHVTLDPGGYFALIEIIDNDFPTISIEDETITETNASQTVSVDVTLSEAHPSKTITVNYATANDSATTPFDYTQKNDTLTFVPNDTTETITVSVVGDTLDEGEGTDPQAGQSFEEFFINLNAPQNATILDPQSTVTITDDDPMPTLSVTDVTVLEGTNPGTCQVQAIFGFNLSAPSGRTVSVNFGTAHNTTNNPFPPQDLSLVSGFHNFFPGQTGKSQTVNVCSDNVNESDETFFVNLHSPTNATISDSQGVGTITDDD